MKPKKTSPKKKIASPRKKPVSTAKKETAKTPAKKRASVSSEKKTSSVTEPPKLKRAVRLIKAVAEKVVSPIANAVKTKRKPAAEKPVPAPVVPEEIVAKTVSKAPRKTAARKTAVRKTAVRKKVPSGSRVRVARKLPAKEPELAPSATPNLPVTLSEKTFTAPAPKPVRKAPASVPAILLEGDKPEVTPISGPGQRYSLGPTPPMAQLESEGELPKAYGTQQLLLTARDPHWLYAHWDLTDEQQRRYNALSRDRHLVLRIHAPAVSSRAEQEVHLHPESRHWFVHVNRAGTKYSAELGYYSPNADWVTVTASSATLTPPDAMAEDTSAEFTTIPFEVPMGKLLSLVKEAVEDNLPLAEALQEIRAIEHPELPEFPMPQNSDHGFSSADSNGGESAWTPAQERALAEIISMDHVRRVWMGSLEITELIRRQAVREFPFMAPEELARAVQGAPTSPMQAPGAEAAPGAITSPSVAPGQRGKGFWFNINAELIIYGATEADAQVTIAGRAIRLRPDGSFSYRFALPDGNYELPVVAVSADKTDGRAAELAFSRRTDVRGDVGIHPQDSQLKRPEAASL